MSAGNGENKKVSYRIRTSEVNAAWKINIISFEGFYLSGTYKLRKSDLQKESYHLDKCHGDALFIYQSSSRSYVPLTAELQQQIDRGEYTRI